MLIIIYLYIQENKLISNKIIILNLLVDLKNEKKKKKEREIEKLLFFYTFLMLFY